MANRTGVKGRGRPRPATKATPARAQAARTKPARAQAKPARVRAKPARAAAKPARAPAKPARAPAKPARAPAKPTRAKATRTEARPPRAHAANDVARWPAFVAEHGVVLASARGPVPSVAAAIAGEPIVGSWWSHPKAQRIFDALSAIDDDDDIRCFKLIDRKVTFVHRRLWPALAALAAARVLDAAQVASVQQEHLPTGEHRTFTTPYPDWVPDEDAARAAALGVDDAKALLGGWLP